MWTKRDVCASKRENFTTQQHKLTTGLPNNVISNNWVSSYIQITTTERSEEGESKLAFDPAFVARVLATGGWIARRKGNTSHSIAPPPSPSPSTSSKCLLLHDPTLPLLSVLNEYSLLLLVFVLHHPWLQHRESFPQLRHQLLLILLPYQESSHLHQY